MSISVLSILAFTSFSPHRPHSQRKYRTPDPQIILYPGRTGRPDFALRVEGGTVWLTQAEVAELFQTTTPNINIHIRNILKERELDADSVVKESLITAADGKNYRTKLYRLEMILTEAEVIAQIRQHHRQRQQDLDRRRAHKTGIPNLTK